MTLPIPKKRKVIRANALAFAKLIRCLQLNPSTLYEMAEESGLHYITVRRYMYALHQENAVHVSGWEKDSRGRDAIKVFKFGAGKDKPRHKFTGVERQRRVRAKKKQLAMINFFRCPTNESSQDH
jgi:predicted ArsR family transcriptional regulator